MRYFNSVLWQCCLLLDMLIVVCVPCKGQLIDAPLPEGTVVAEWNAGDTNRDVSVDALEKNAEVTVKDLDVESLFVEPSDEHKEEVFSGADVSQ